MVEGEQTQHMVREKGWQKKAAFSGDPAPPSSVVAGF